MERKLALWGLLSALLLLGSDALAGLKVTMSCPTTVTRTGSASMGVTFQNDSANETISVTKGAFALHLGGVLVTGPKKMSPSQMAVPVNVPAASIVFDPCCSVIPATVSTTIQNLTGFNRASVGTIAGIGLGFFGTTTTPSSTSSVKPLGTGSCVVEVQ